MRLLIIRVEEQNLLPGKKKLRNPIPILVGILTKMNIMVRLNQYRQVKEACREV